MNKMYFVGGYYGDSIIIYENEVQDKIFSHPEIFDIESLLKMGFVGDFVDGYNSENEITDENDENYLIDAWDLLNEEEKAKILVEMMQGDDLAGIILCESLEKANEVLYECLYNLKCAKEQEK